MVTHSVHFADALWADSCKDRGFLGARLGGVLPSGAVGPQFVAGFLRPAVNAFGSCVTFSDVLLRCNPLKVARSVVRLVPVFVVDVIRGLRLFKPTDRNHAVNKPLPSGDQVSHWMLDRGVRGKPSKQLAVFGNCVQVIEDFVDHAFVRKSFQAVPFRYVDGQSMPQKE